MHAGMDGRSRTAFDASARAVPGSIRRTIRPPATRSRTIRAVLTALALTILPLAVLPGCSSSGSASDARPEKTGKPIELRYRAIASKLSLGLVNESHTDRTELYSERQPVDQATTKVSTDEVVEAIVEFFRDQGYFEIAQSGAAPTNPPAGTSQILEVVLPEGAYHAVLRTGVTADHITKFQTCAKALVDVYNSTMQLQAVDAAPDWNARNGSRRPRSAGGKSGG